MIDSLKEKLLYYSYDFDQWTNSFDNFVKYCPRDTDKKMFKHRKTPSYCIWEQTQSKIFTISYRYVHCLDSQGNMHCLQEHTATKINGIENFTFLETEKSLPILKNYVEIKLRNKSFLYTHFASPQGLGYPPPYMIFNIMKNSKNPIWDYQEYIKNLVDTYCNLVYQCITKKLPVYRANRVLTNHFVNESLFFKDSVFFETEENFNIDRLADFWHCSIDGFRRAEGIVDAYRSRQDSTQLGEQNLFSAIEECKDYAREKCLSLKNVKVK